MIFKSTFFRFLAFLILIGSPFALKAQDLVITTQVCGNTGGSTVRMTGPFWGWDPNAGPVAVDNSNGTYTFTLSPAPGADMEYLISVDGVQENLISAMQNGGTCAPVTDYSNYANRKWATTDPLSISNVYGQCGPCAVSNNLELIIDVCGALPNEVRITGPFWGWDPAGGPIASDNGNGTWSVTLTPPTADMQYLVIVDGVQENLIQDMVNGGSCAPITDYFSYANRVWLTTDPLTVNVNYDRCVPCSYPDLTITTTVCDTNGVSAVKIIGPPNWDWNIGKTMTNNGDGTWSYTYSPAPSDTVEYLISVDQVAENLVQEMVNGATCAPSTDYSSYANRRWVLTDPANVNNTYNTCLDCNGGAGINELGFEFAIYPNPSSGNLYLSEIPTGFTYSIYNAVGKMLISGNPSTSIDVSALSNGIYFFELAGNGKVGRISFIKN